MAFSIYIEIAAHGDSGASEKLFRAGAWELKIFLSFVINL